MSAGKPKKTLKGDYEIGYGKPPKATQFQPGHTGNPSGRPRGRPSVDELFLDEAARLVKFKIGDKVAHMDRDRAVTRKLFDLALQGNIRAIEKSLERLRQAQAGLAAKADSEAPLTEDEIAVIALMPKQTGG